jgi:hypothetical protein
MNTADSSVAYLERYYPFADSVMEDVSRAADEMNRKTFDSVVADFDLQDGPEIIPGYGRAKPIELLKFTPSGDYQREKVRLLQTPMGSSVNDFTIWEAATLFSADPSEQLWVVGGPSSPRQNIGRLTLDELVKVSLTHNLRPTIDTSLHYLRDKEITVVDHLGYSAGSDKAATAIQYSDRYDLWVDKGVLIEPATVVKRSLFGLMKCFNSCGAQMQHYIDESESTPYIDRWSKERFWQDMVYRAKLLRLSNIAIATALKHDGFGGRLDATLEAQPESIITVGWGTNSELTDNRSIERVVDEATEKYGRNRIIQMPLLGVYHAGMNNPLLYAAMMLQGLRPPTTTETAGIPASRRSIDLDRAV